MNAAWSDPILTCADAKALETRLFGGDEEHEWAAMQRAGAGVARAVLADFREIGGFPDGGRVLVLAGKGHNGGDALLAAKAILAESPAASADVFFACGERALRPLTSRAWRQLLEAAPQRVRSLDQVPLIGGAQPCLRPAAAASAGDGPRYDLCVDGIFGFQFHPPVEPAVAEVLRTINGRPGIRLRAAVDLPSGVGEAAGAIAFRADFTYATGSVKAPLLDPRHCDAVGRLRYLDLGFFEHTGVGSPLAGDRPVPSRASALPTDFILKSSVLAPLAALRAPRSDKRTFGHLFVIGGSRSYPGAVLMCARAALRSGVGLVTVFAPESLVAAYAACAPEAIWVGWPEAPDGGLALAGLPLLRARLERATALVVGPGLGSERETLALAVEVLKLAETPVGLDADALQPSILAAAQGKRMICLPHAGEFQRLAGGREATPTVLGALARETGATIVLKGPVTRIAGGDRVYHSFFGGPVLARGGSGDLLAGLAGGLLAQAPDDPLIAACRGVVWHGLAADLLARDRGQVAVAVTQLLDFLPAALREAAR